MKRSLLPFAVVLALTSTLASAEIPELAFRAAAPTSAGVALPVRTVTSALSSGARPAGLELAPGDARRLPFPDAARERIRDLDAWFSVYPTHRLHAQLDRPLYRPGDTVSLKVWDLETRGLEPGSGAMTVQLVDPRGTVQQTRSVQVERGSVSDAFVLDAAAVGGSWKVELVSADGTTVDRPFVVSSFEAPRVKKTLEFARDGYGPGEIVEASVTLERATGEPLADVVATARVQADGVALDPQELRTNSRGEATVRFTLPAELAAPDVVLTVLVDDGGVTESISRPVPVTLDRVAVRFFPEGGDLVAGLPARVYFEGTDVHGEPADVEGMIVDDRGRKVASLGSWHDGRGHVSFTPAPGRSYEARIRRAAGAVDAVFPLPAVLTAGCALRHHDDLDGEQRAVRVSVTCTDARDVIVLASQQEQVLDRAAIRVSAGAPTTVHLKSGVDPLSGAQGVARVTVLGEDLSPLAERLVYRNRGRQLSVAITADKDRYSPRDEVVLTVRTTDPEGRAVPAELSLAVVDDTLLAFADDSEHDLLSRTLLQADLPEPIEDVAGLFRPGRAEAGLGLDLVLGTRGWRRFDWAPIAGTAERAVAIRRELKEQEEAEAQQQLRMLGYMGYAEGDRGDWGGLAAAADAPMAMPRPAAMPVGGARKAAARAPQAEAPPPMSAPADESNEKRKDIVRQFAAPLGRDDDAEAPRTDFRDTVLWAPSVRTGASGVAEVRFPLSDAVTGFRVTAEGHGDSWLGRGEALLASTLPFHLEARLPQQLSAGDELLLPVTLENQRDGNVEVDLSVEVSDLLELGAMPADVALRSGERKTVYVPMTAAYGNGPAELSLTAHAGSLSDAVVRSIPIVPRGYPVSLTASGVVEDRVTETVRIPAALEGSITGRVTVFPSPVSELLSGMEQMVRTPGGCFEQTSSTNYPNVLVLDWLDRTGAGGKLGAHRQQVLEAGYQILSGYQVGTGGFETWGDGPGKEALSAYGLLQFSDMARVFEVDPKIIEDNVAYLYQQRDGKGGYAITGASAHGYGTAPPEVLDAYITYALVETGHTDLTAEIESQARLARTSKDPYRLALATLTLLATRPDQGRTAAARLKTLQAEDGSFPGSETSITRSENQNLTVEATALATMALLRAGDRATAEEAVRWFHGNQTGPGSWGATQGNALALKAISEAAQASARTDGPGHVEVTVDGELVAEQRFEAGEREPLDLDIGPWLSTGTHTVVVTLDGGALPYALDVSWASETPASDETRRVDLTTALASSALRVGETTRLTASLTNRTREVVPEPMARIGLPAGLEAQTWQLEQLKDRGDIAFFETRPREVTVYWNGLGVDEVHDLALDLVAAVPGTFTGPASTAYPYYDDQARAWVAGLEVAVKP